MSLNNNIITLIETNKFKLVKKDRLFSIIKDDSITIFDRIITIEFGNSNILIICGRNNEIMNISIVGNQNVLGIFCYFKENIELFM